MQLICLCILLNFYSPIFAFNCDHNDEDYCYTENSNGELFSRERRSVNFYQTGKKVQNEMSRTLDQIFGSHYNKRIRPDYGGKPVLVELNLSIRSIVSLIKYFENYFLEKKN